MLYIMDYLHAYFHPKIVFENHKMEKNDLENFFFALDIAMLWQGRMKKGPKFL